MDACLVTAHGCRVFVIVTVGVFFLVGQVFSQRQADPSRPSPQAPPASQQPQTAASVSSPPEFAVPLPEANDRLNNLDRLLRHIHDQLSEADDPAKSAEEAKVASEKLSATANQATASLKEAPTIEELQDMEENWRQQARRIERVRKPITQRLTELEQHISQLQSERELWQRARAQYQQVVGVKVLVERASDLLARIGQTLALAQKDRQLSLMTQDLLARQQLMASEVLDHIQDTEKKYSDTLLRPDKRPLWQVFSPQAHPSAKEASRSISIWWSHKREALKSGRSTLLWMLLLSFIVSYVAVRLARKIAARQQGRTGCGDTSLFDQNPDRLALMLAVWLLSWLPQVAPLFLGYFLHSVLSVVFLLLIPPLFPPAFRPLMHLLAGIYVLGRSWSLFATVPLLERLTSIVAMAAVIAIAAQLMRPSRLKKFPGEALVPRFVIHAIWLALALLAGGWVANFLGYSSLSRLLITGTIRSVFLAVRFYALARIAGALFSLLLRSRWAQSLASIRLSGSVLYLWVSRVVVGILVISWILRTLDNFGVADRVLTWLNSVFGTRISVGAIGFTFWDVIIFGLVLLASYAFSRTVGFFLQEDVLPRLSLQRGLPNAILTLIHYTLLAIGFLLALAAVGMDLTRFTVLAGAFGVGIGFGLQNVISNFVSGLILLFERPVNLNDTVEIGGLVGQVKHIGIRAITIHTGQGADVIVPNSSLVSNQFINWTYLDTVRRFDLKIMVVRGTEPERVLRLLADVSRAIPEIEKHPAPSALFMGFGENALNFELRYWLQVGTPPEIESKVALLVDSELRKAGIEVPVPQRDLYLKSITAGLLPQPGEREEPSSGEERSQKRLTPVSLNVARRTQEATPTHSRAQKTTDSME